MSRRLVITLLVLALSGSVIAGYLAARPVNELPKDHPPTIDPQSDIADELYLQTLEDIEDKNYPSAGVKLGRVDRAWRGSKNEEKMVRKVKDDLYSKGVTAIKEKKWADAKGPIDALFVADPNFKDVRTKRKQVDKKLQTGTAIAGKTAPATNHPDGEFVESTRILDPTAEQKGLPYKEQEEGPATEIPANAKPIDLVAKGLPGYKTTQRSLLGGDSHRAGGTYVPTDPKTKEAVNRIVTTVVKRANALDAVDELKNRKTTFPKNRQEFSVNRHDAYFGVYEIGDPKIFPPLATIAWTRGQWLFAVDVVPKAGATVDQKKEAGLFAARAWGY